jgi:hypothetical protein
MYRIPASKEINLQSQESQNHIIQVFKGTIITSGQQANAFIYASLFCYAWSYRVMYLGAEIELTDS